MHPSQLPPGRRNSIVSVENRAVNTIKVENRVHSAFMPVKNRRVVRKIAQGWMGFASSKLTLIDPTRK
jgi:hypothetical protein